MADNIQIGNVVPKLLPENWVFSKDDILNAPSIIRAGDAMSHKVELRIRQICSTLIQDIASRLSINQLCINSGIVYMQRFYMLQPMQEYSYQILAPACLFLACKCENNMRRLQLLSSLTLSLIEGCPELASQNGNERNLSKSERLCIRIKDYEFALLKTLGFDLWFDHPHTYVIKICEMIVAPKEITQSAYYVATVAMRLTTVFLCNPTTLLACMAVHLACDWSKFQITSVKKDHGKQWYEYVDDTITLDMLENIGKDFMTEVEEAPARSKTKFMRWKAELELAAINSQAPVLVAPDAAHYPEELPCNVNRDELYHHQIPIKADTNDEHQRSQVPVEMTNTAKAIGVGAVRQLPIEDVVKASTSHTGQSQIRNDRAHAQGMHKNLAGETSHRATAAQIDSTTKDHLHQPESASKERRIHGMPHVKGMLGYSAVERPGKHKVATKKEPQPYHAEYQAHGNGKERSQNEYHHQALKAVKELRLDGMAHVTGMLGYNHPECHGKHKVPTKKFPQQYDSKEPHAKGRSSPNAYARKEADRAYDGSKDGRTDAKVRVGNPTGNTAASGCHQLESSVPRRVPTTDGESRYTSAEIAAAKARLDKLLAKQRTTIAKAIGSQQHNG